MSDGGDFTLWREGLPRWLERESLEIAPGATRPCGGPGWSDAIVVVEYGTVVLAIGDARRLPLAEGAILCLAGVDEATIHNPDGRVALLSVGRRRPA